jgi:hypothetical protein
MAEMVKSVRINPLVKKILVWWHKRFFKSGIFSFAEKMRRAENVLICLPAKKESFTVAKDHLYIFADIFQNKKVSVFLPFIEGETSLLELERYKVISPRKEDLKIFSVPRREFIQEIKGYAFEIALDLDLQDGFINSYLCLKSGAELRIGFKGKAGFPFYNLQLALSKERLGQEELYGGIEETLKSLMQGFAVDEKENRNSISKR